MARLPDDIRGAVPKELHDAFDSLIERSNGTMPIGPGSVAALSPEMALERVGLSGYVRWRLKLPQLVQELAILLTARQMDCAYVWNAHAGLAREEGASDGLVDAMRDRQQLPTMTDDETAVVGFVTELLTAHRVSDSAFSAAKQRFGLGNVVDLMALVGQYVTNASFVNAFELPLPQEVTEPRLKV